MTRSLPVVLLLLMPMAVSGQHGTGFRGGSMTGFRFGAGGFRGRFIAGLPAGRDTRFFRSGFNRRFGNFGYPYSYLWADPYLWAYPFLDDDSLGYRLPPPEDRATDNTTIAQPSTPPVSPPPYSQPAHPVIHEYKWNEASGAGATTFTIALKDGSKRYPVTIWVQDGNLNYIDSEGHQQVLSADIIDRNATERLNRQNNLNVQLPPG
jgi:hypothetical protein